MAAPWCCQLQALSHRLQNEGREFLLAGIHRDLLLDFTHLQRAANGFQSSVVQNSEIQACEPHDEAMFIDHSCGTGISCPIHTDSSCGAGISCPIHTDSPCGTGISCPIHTDSSCGTGISCPIHPCHDCVTLLHVSTLTQAIDIGVLTEFHLLPLTQNLVWCLTRGDGYLVHATSTCLLHTIRVQRDQVKQIQPCLEALLQGFQNDGDGLSNAGRVGSVLSLFRELLKSCASMRSFLEEVLLKHWANLQANVSAQTGRGSQSALHAWLSLWKEVLRTCPQRASLELRQQAPFLLELLRAGTVPGFVKLKALGVLRRLVDVEEGLQGRLEASALTRVGAGITTNSPQSGNHVRQPTLQDHNTNICEHIADWVEGGHLEDLASVESLCTSGFGWRLGSPGLKLSCHHHLRRKLCLLCLKAVSVGLAGKPSHHHNKDQFLDVVGALVRHFSADSARTEPWGWVSELFSDQDDDWINALLAVLQLYPSLQRYCTDQKVWSVLDACNIHGCFRDLLSGVLYDHSVLVDLLASPETEFLLFLTQYLRVVRRHWSDFTAAHGSFPSHRLIEATESSGMMDTPWNSCKIEAAESSSLIEVPESSSLTDVPESSSLIEAAESSPGHIKEVTSAMEMENSSASGGQNLPPTQDISSAHGTPTALGYLRVYGCDSDDSGDSDMSVSRPDVPDTGFENTFPDSPAELLDIVDVEESLKAGESALDRTMSTLIRLRFALDHLCKAGLFPYMVKPLISLLEQCEEMYERRSNGSV